MDFEVRVNSYEVIDLPLMDPYVHNEIGFYEIKDGEATPLLFCNGLHFNRQGNDSDSISFLDPNDTLRVLCLPVPVYELQNTDMGFLDSQTIHIGNTIEEFIDMSIRAFETATFINSQNLDYIPYSMGDEAQNSNSVARTLVKAMSNDERVLDFSMSGLDMNAPGHNRVLLPSQARPSVVDLLKLDQLSDADKDSLIVNYRKYFDVKNKINVNDALNDKSVPDLFKTYVYLFLAHPIDSVSLEEGDYPKKQAYERNVKGKPPYRMRYVDHEEYFDPTAPKPVPEELDVFKMILKSQSEQGVQPSASEVQVSSASLNTSFK